MYGKNNFLFGILEDELTKDEKGKNVQVQPIQLTEGREYLFICDGDVVSTTVVGFNKLDSSRFTIKDNILHCEGKPVGGFRTLRSGDTYPVQSSLLDGRDLMVNGLYVCITKIKEGSFVNFLVQYNPLVDSLVSCGEGKLNYHIYLIKEKDY